MVRAPRMPLATPAPSPSRPAVLRLAVAGLLSVLLPALVGPAPQAQTPEAEALAGVVAALQTGDAGRLLDGSVERLEISLFGQGSVYSRGQASHVLRDFFRRFPPERVAFGEQVVADDGRTAMGRYWTTEGGHPLRVYVRLRQADDAWRLAALRLDRPTLFRPTGGK